MNIKTEIKNLIKLIEKIRKRRIPFFFSNLALLYALFKICESNSRKEWKNTKNVKAVISEYHLRIWKITKKTPIANSM